MLWTACYLSTKWEYKAKLCFYRKWMKQHDYWGQLVIRLLILWKNVWYCQTPTAIITKHQKTKVPYQHWIRIHLIRGNIREFCKIFSNLKISVLFLENYLKNQLSSPQIFNICIMVDFEKYLWCSHKFLIKFVWVYLKFMTLRQISMVLRRCKMYCKR